MKKYPSPANLLLYLGSGGYLFLLIITWLHQQPPLYDEPLFIPNVYLFEQYGLSREFLVNIDQQAPGPLYQFIHYPLRHITHLETPGIRLVNTVLLGLMILLLTAIITHINNTGKKQSFVLALNMMAIPMVWNVSGMALTEVPPMFFATLSVLFLLYALQKQEHSLVQSILLTLLAGAAAGLAILGRSPFLVLVPAAGALLLYHFRHPRRWMIVVIYAAVALAMCLPVFYIWKGLTPPQQAFTGAGGLSFEHGMLAFAYGALITLLIAPRWFYFNKKIPVYLLAAYVLFLVLNITLVRFEFGPLSVTMEKILPAPLMRLYPFVISPALAVIAVYFIICSLLRAWERRTEPFYLYLFGCAMLMLATSLKVTHLFSSRYVAQAAPFFVLLLLPFDRFSYGKCVRLVIGMVIGLLSLETYFLFQ
ncbi:glycosyltransferase family 39 protein [Chitinophaga japonensis]|uniref:Dolichyl-phosphate-mannose-protein mannosyltransferase n=1 Tax=Chitinophaga japonensis TaxID=104662 RepID=A0A562SXW0_CHIJA|nr:glycosyltransferase family 39 protein [Chitinophaga japonensis]TWI86199.1 dolichyl-phosphate-mannose-protein mannosyltransferase [Chitinophaga japonensis]